MLMKYRLFTPGPTSVPEATLLELAKPVTHHRTGEFRAMFNELQANLQYVFQTKQTVYTIIGALPFKMDEWGVDVAITGSQKALMLPPGLGYLALSDRAWAAVDKNKSRQDFYFDIKKYRKSIEDGDTPFTPANTLIAAQAISLRMIKEETLQTVWKRTHLIAESFRQGVKALGFEIFSKYPADSVTAVKYPAGITDKEFRSHLKSKHNIHIAGGQGSMEGKLFRVNHMGYTDAYDALATVAAI